MTHRAERTELRNKSKGDRWQRQHRGKLLADAIKENAQNTK